VVAVDSWTTSVLVGTTLTTAAIHTLIPDHWLPFVLIGRARGWTLMRTAFVSGGSAAIHTVLSAGLGLVAAAIGVEAARAAGEDLETASGVLLVAFGLLYALWSWRKGGHFHPGGARVHARGEAEPCAGSEGTSSDHLHYHADAGWIRDPARRSDVALALIVGMNPCVLILPLLLAAARDGGAAVAAVTTVYSATTVGLMVGLSVAGVAGLRGFRVPGIAKHMEAVSGLLVAATGLLFVLSG
jgi:ABC-type nickel/cobalt efflux system permease component RcnA